MKRYLEHVWKNDGQPINKKLAIVVLGPLIILIFALGLYLFGNRYVSTDNAYVKADKAMLSAEVSGKISEVLIKDNSRVSKGDTLIIIDSEPFQIAVTKAEANLINVKAEIESMRSEYLQKLAEFNKAEEAVSYNQREAERYKELADKLAGTKQKSDQAQYDLYSSESARDAAKQEAESLKAKLGGDPKIAVEDHPNYKLALSELEKAKLDLSRINITAPADGVLTNVETDVGEYITAGLPIFTLVNDNNQWIEANFKETDLTNVKVGQLADIEIDTFPGITWKAKVTSITPATGSEFSILPSQNSSGNWVKVVQRIMVKLELEDNKDKPKLTAGMSAFVKVDTEYSRLGRFFGLGK